MMPGPMTILDPRPGINGLVKEDDSVSVTTVVNLKGHRDDPGLADVVYVGRAMHRGGWHLAASPLASPFRPGPDGSREEVVARYREYLLGRADLLALLPELRGRRLGCWCAPQPCHAAVIAELADAGSAAPG
jgi:energy-converting hydrogenase Eha subunit B